METISDNKIIEIHFTLTDDNGETLDSSTGEGPLAYLHGAENIVPGLEKVLLGKKVGDKFNASIPPEEAYGILQEDLLQTLPKSEFGDDADKIQVGDEFEVETEDGQIVIVTAVEVNDDHVLVDGNHPLAGETLHFDIEVISVREASEEELEHGHPIIESGGCGCS
ncbi:peptidylprolyl isomerase [Bacteriovorax sp. Seq25_V]|uniref:FKBP-type peptidyl-prolyl cis-trans isomerase n=1 Tax=Bacteriovorax sp. Seq25_V TaxID=1201288 RepID=UPI000389FD53|nr:peptidylprolyl isomerase [Bacteriovorax sp. Seq25_V]EQC47904.1 peptidyl-prolyl cis-trans isomerase, FKBP-type [Bacteriovorax sp. Seq25_V]